jgi:hypothetical protein
MPPIKNNLHPKKKDLIDGLFIFHHNFFDRRLSGIIMQKKVVAGGYTSACEELFHLKPKVQYNLAGCKKVRTFMGGKCLCFML